jgi:hypothetical protein
VERREGEEKGGKGGVKGRRREGQEGWSEGKEKRRPE